MGMYNGLAKQLWWKNKMPDIFNKAKYFSTEVSWVNWKLTGVWVGTGQKQDFLHNIMHIPGSGTRKYSKRQVLLHHVSQAL